MPAHSAGADRRLFRLADPTLPRDRECVACFLWRMVEEVECDGSARWLLLWRDWSAPRAVALEARLLRRGCRCDCAVLDRHFVLREELVRLARHSWDGAETSYGVSPHDCLGTVRRGSTRPCGLWLGP